MTTNSTAEIMHIRFVYGQVSRSWSKIDIRMEEKMTGVNCRTLLKGIPWRVIQCSMSLLQCWHIPRKKNWHRKPFYRSFISIKKVHFHNWKDERWIPQSGLCIVNNTVVRCTSRSSQPCWWPMGAKIKPWEKHPWRSQPTALCLKSVS